MKYLIVLSFFVSMAVHSAVPLLSDQEKAASGRYAYILQKTICINQICNPVLGSHDCDKFRDFLQYYPSGLAAVERMENDFTLEDDTRRFLKETRARLEQAKNYAERALAAKKKVI